MCKKKMSMKEWADKVVDMHKNRKELESYSHNLRLCSVSKAVQIHLGIKELSEELGVKLQIRRFGTGSVETFFKYRGVEFFTLGDFR